jgi:S-layer homology domain.
MNMKKILAFVLILATFLVSTVAYADFSDVTGDLNYYDAVNRLNALGIMTGSDENTFNPQGMVTREQFSEIIIKASGLTDTAMSMKGSTIYSDVDPYSDMSGYISLAVSKGYIAGLLDSEFKPYDNVTFAQVCTAVVRALGYTDKDVTGLWPKNYIEKASKLEITKDMDLKYSDGVPRWAMALIIDRLLDTNVNSTTGTKSFADSAGLYTECIILANSITSTKLAENQVQTDKGIYYVGNNINLELGNTYRVDITDNDTIKAAYGSQRVLESISVESSVGTKVAYRNDKGELTYKTLPEKTVYYYQGSKIEYDNIKNILKTRTSIVFAYNKSKTGYEYAIIFDPVSSKPEVARGFDPSSRQIGAISVPSDAQVIRDGVLTDILHIREKDVVYSVSDIWNKYTYIMAVSDKVGGKVTDVLPDRVNPKTIQIDGKDYSISQDIDITKLKIRPGSLEKDDNIIVLLGNDGKIVDLEFPGNSATSNYAVVINYSAKISGNTKGKLDVMYSVKLLTSDGITATYYTGMNPEEYKGKLVKFKWQDRQNIIFEAVQYNYPKELSVNKYQRSINDSYASDDIKIFNIVSSEPGADAVADLIDLNDLPDGTLPNNKVFYMEKSGPFNDVSIIVTNDLREEKYKAGVIKSFYMGVSGESIVSNYTIIVDGKEYSYTDAIGNPDIGAVTNVKIVNGKIDWADNTRKPDVKSTAVQAYDTKRIKVNDTVYWLKNNITVYFTDYQGNVKVKSLADVKIDEFYGQVSLYLDKTVENGGRVEVIVVKQ